MLMTDQDRLRLEQDILGIIISCNCYQHIAHILKENNFKDWPDQPHRLIFKTIEECGPAVRIDLVIINQLLQPAQASMNLKLEYLGIENYIRHITSRIGSSANLVYQSFLLLEHDLTVKLMQLLLQQAQNLTQSSDKAIAVEAYDMLKEDGDVFEMLEQLPEYMEKACYPPAMVNDIRKFAEQVDRRIFDLKKIEQLDNIVHNLLGFAEMNQFDKPHAAIKILTATIKHIAFEEDIADELYTKIDELKQLLG